MVTMTSAAFLGALRSSGLLEGQQLGELGRSGVVQGDDPRPLARQILHRGWLTPYQVNQILSGHGPALVLGSYVLLERLGEGGMGQVYKARHQKLGRIVALKVIRKDRTTDVEAVRRFRREIQAVSQLSHPNIVLALDADELEGTHFYVMEYVEGTNLKDLVRRSGPLAVPVACEYIRQAALGLQHISQHGLVHRDIKPSNLMLVSTGVASGECTEGMRPHSSVNTHPAQVKILDLGLARLRWAQAADDASDTLTRTGVVMGTPDYIASEQAANPHGADVRADLYSLGCTFHFLLTGNVPFPGGTTVEKLFRHRSDDPDPLPRHVPKEVQAVIRKLMAKRPEQRYQQPQELADALAPLVGLPKHETSNAGRDLLPTSSGAGDATALGRGDPTRRPRPRRRLTLRRGLAAVAVLLLLVAVGGLGAFLLAEDYDVPAKEPVVAETTPAGTAAVERRYVRRNSRNESILATLKANGVPTLEGAWHIIGPFDLWRPDNKPNGFREGYAPEKEIQLSKTYKGRGNQSIGWKEFTTFRLGEVVNLANFGHNDNVVVYLYHEFDAREHVQLPLSLGSDDTLTVWFNGQTLIAKEGHRGCQPDSDLVTLAVRPGKNQLLIKVCNYNNTFGIYVMPQLTASLENAFGASLRRDFPRK